MTNRTWSDAEEAALRALMDEGVLTQRQMAKKLNRGLASVGGKIANIRAMANHTRWQAPTYRQTDERKHLSLIHAANGHGFVWLPESLAARFYELEQAPADKSWWRGAA